jgi:hypothetical protein
MATGENSSARDRTPWARRAAAATLAATFIASAPIAASSAWIRGTVLSTSGYVAAISNIADSPAVRTVIRDAVTAEASAVLPPAGGVLAGPLRTWLVDLAGKETSAFMAGPAFRRLWIAANRFAHTQLISVLNGNSTLVRATGKQVTLNLIPLVSDVLHGILHALTSGFFTLTTWCVAGSLALTTVALLSGPYRWAAAIRRCFRLTGR